ncbi:hypothetical protein BGE01nite_23630 [Brevifollis gellanilyticus]|uniref:Uncharacterized protein n=1 Tax=Brevifollis gellanilyticus TaxID=748831 RepID=A0A512M8M4_9BACT|nr:hypothetical protein BGE01nite_23630 [Brevifollis gellanilyticus]
MGIEVRREPPSVIQRDVKAAREKECSGKGEPKVFHGWEKEDADSWKLAVLDGRGGGSVQPGIRVIECD